MAILLLGVALVTPVASAQSSFWAGHVEVERANGGTPTMSHTPNMACSSSWNGIDHFRAECWPSAMATGEICRAPGVTVWATGGAGSVSGRATCGEATAQCSVDVPSAPTPPVDELERPRIDAVFFPANFCHDVTVQEGLPPLVCDVHYEPTVTDWTVRCYPSDP